MKTIALVLIRVYQWLISPLLGAACRYTPTCSHYAAEALEYHGFFKGSALSAWRLLRCHPFAKGGLDTVPMPGRSPSAISRQRGYSFSKKEEHS